MLRGIQRRGRLLAMKRAHPLPASPILPAERFDFSLARAQQCPSIEKIDSFEQWYPDWGMPFGLPALNEREYATLTEWIAAGA